MCNLKLTGKHLFLQQMVSYIPPIGNFLKAGNDFNIVFLM